MSKKGKIDFGKLDNVVVLWIMVILVNFGVMWIGQFALSMFQGFSTLVMFGIAATIFYIDACLATVNVKKKRLQIKSDFIKPNKKKIGLSGLMIIIFAVLI